jgi:hypothetical protein
MALTRVEQLKKVQDEGLHLFERKNRDYGDAFATYGTVGVLVRMGDKIMRLQSITNKGITLVDDERLRDTLIDLHNYAAMAVMLLDEEEKDNTLILESNIESQEAEVISWKIYGSNGDIYTRTQTKVGNKIIKEKCSCLSFIYSKNNTCKHIRNSENFNIIN